MERCRYRTMGQGVNRALFAVVLAALAVGAGVAAGWRGRPSPAPLEASTEDTMSGSAAIEVHVAGWVMSPGVVSVDEGSIVAEAVEAAGGLRPGALTESLNLAAEVSAGEQIVVPGPTMPGAGTATGAPGGPLTLNGATAEELEELPGVGPVLAERIVSYRESNGRFETVDDLLEVPGIGEAKLASIRDLVRP